MVWAGFYRIMYNSPYLNIINGAVCWNRNRAYLSVKLPFFVFLYCPTLPCQSQNALYPKELHMYGKEGLF